MSRSTVRSSMLAAAALCLAASTGCLEPSLNPLFGPEDARVDARLEGRWVCNDSGTNTWTFTRKDDTYDHKPVSYYRIAIKDDDDSGELDAVLGRIGGRDFMTFSADADGLSQLPRFVKRQFIGVNTFGRLVIERDRVQILMMPADWADDHRDDILYGLGAPQGEHGYVLTAPTKALQAMVELHADDKGAFQEAVTLVRPGKTGGTCYAEK